MNLRLIQPLAICMNKFFSHHAVQDSNVKRLPSWTAVLGFDPGSSLWQQCDLGDLTTLSRSQHL
jgi:hypothetical protein